MGPKVDLPVHDAANLESGTLTLGFRRGGKRPIAGLGRADAKSGVGRSTSPLPSLLEEAALFSDTAGSDTSRRCLTLRPMTLFS
jgi:hypothetical protein